MKDMKCNVNGGWCRICPGMWVAAALLLFSLVQGLVSPGRPSAADKGNAATAQQAETRDAVPAQPQ